MISYIISHWELIVICVLAVLAMGWIAFVLKNWKVAIGAVVLVCVALAYQSANMAGYNRAVSEAAAEQNKTLIFRVQLLSKIADDYEAVQKMDAETIEKLELTASETPKNDNLSLDAAAASRVQRTR